MLIDINTRVGQWPFKKLRYNTCKALLERMNQFGVDLSVTSSINGMFYKNVQSGNAELFEEWNSQKDFRKRIVPFGVIDPSYAGWQKDLDTCHSQWGMKGICIYPQYHDYALNEPFVAELLKAATERKMVVSLTVRMLDSRQNSWIDPGKEETLQHLIPLLRQAPETKFIIGHIANTGSLSNDDVDLLKRGNLLMDTSGRVLNNFKSWLDRYGVEKFAFGSNAPFMDYVSGRLRFELLNNEELPEKGRQRIQHENAARFLGL